MAGVNIPEWELISSICRCKCPFEYLLVIFIISLINRFRNDYPRQYAPFKDIQIFQSYWDVETRTQYARSPFLHISVCSGKLFSLGGSSPPPHIAHPPLHSGKALLNKLAIFSFLLRLWRLPCILVLLIPTPAASSIPPAQSIRFALGTATAVAVHTVSIMWSSDFYLFAFPPQHGIILVWLLLLSGIAGNKITKILPVREIVLGKTAKWKQIKDHCLWIAND